MFKTLFLEILYGLIFLVPPAALVWTVWRERKLHASQHADPFPDLLRRPAGESTRLRVEKLDTEIDEWLAPVVFIPIALALALALQPRQSSLLVIIFFLASAITAAIALRKLRPLIGERANCRLGFQGERYVAEELNLLMADGFDVFHDVPFDGFNIDHVILGERGVFAIETKAKRKPVHRGKKQWVVMFDGKALHFPSWIDVKPVEQTVRNKTSVAKRLSAATGDKIPVTGILTLPGWYSESTVSKAEITVLNPKLIRSFVCGHPPNLAPSIVQRAKYQLEQWCKLPLS